MEVSIEKIEEISNAFYNYSYNKYTKELQNSDKPEKKQEEHFPTQSEFSENFLSKLNTVYNSLKNDYSLKQADYIYETLIANLNRQAQTPEKSRIVNFSKGTINIERLKSYSEKVQDVLKSRHPEKFEVINDNSIKMQTENKMIDFDKPEEKKAFFDKLFDEYNSLKTEEEKEEYKRKRFAYYDENKLDVDNYLNTQELARKKKEENPEKSDDECLKEAMKENNISEKDFSIPEILAKISELNKQYYEMTNNNSPEAQNLQMKISELQNEYQQLKQEKVVQEEQQALEGTEDKEKAEKFEDLDYLFDAEFDADKEQELTEKSSNENFEREKSDTQDEQISQSDQANNEITKFDKPITETIPGQNQTLHGAKPEDFKVTQKPEVQQEQSLIVPNFRDAVRRTFSSIRDNLSNGFKTLRDNISNLFSNRNNVVKAIDTAENNTRTEGTNKFAESIAINNTGNKIEKQANEAAEENRKKGSNVLRVNSTSQNVQGRA